MSSLRSRIATVLIGSVVVVSAQASPRSIQDLIRGGTPSSRYGVYLLGETMPSSVNPLATRDAGGYAVNPIRQPGTSGSLFYVGAVSNGYYDVPSGSSPSNGRNDLLGFQITENDSDLSTIDVVNARIANAEGTLAGSINQFGTNSVSNSGQIAVRMGMGSGNSNGWGLISATSPYLTVFGTSYTTPTSGGAGYSLLSTNNSVVHNMPSIGANNGVSLNATFNKEIVAASTSYSTGTTYGAHTLVIGTVNATNSDNRGAVTYNDTAGIAAVLRAKTVKIGSVNVTHCTAVAVYRVTFSLLTGLPELRDLSNTINPNGTEIALPTYVNPSDGKTYTLAGTNYFSRSAYVGPSQISINDNGDIALAAVAVDASDTTDTSQLQERGYRPDKRILVAAFNGMSYNAWQTAAQAGVNVRSTDASGNIFEDPGTGDFVSVNPLVSAYGLAIGNPSLDNNGNVFFTAATQAEVFATGGSTVKVALFRANLSGGSYSVEKVLAEGDVLEDPNLYIDRTVTFVPHSTATSNLANINIQYPSDNCFQVNSALRDGGAILAAKITDGSGDPLAPTRWTFLYIRPKA